MNGEIIIKTLEQIVYETGVMPTLFAEDENIAAQVVSAIEKTEMPVVEILQRGDIAKKVLKQAAQIKKTALIGAGTVCTIEQCKEVVDLGADFIVSPGFNPELVDWCVKNKVKVIPGVSNPSEIMLSVNAGLSLLKAYPFNEFGGLKFFDSIAGAFPQVRFVATGSLGEDDLHYLSHKRIAAIGGVWMFQTESDHTLYNKEKIVDIMNKSITIAKRYKMQ